jgi:hypothetical protein
MPPLPPNAFPLHFGVSDRRAALLGGRPVFIFRGDAAERGAPSATFLRRKVRHKDSINEKWKLAGLSRLAGLHLDIRFHAVSVASMASSKTDLNPRCDDLGANHQATHRPRNDRHDTKT